MKNLITASILCCSLLFLSNVYADTFVKEFPAEKGLELIIKSTFGANVTVNGWEEDMVRLTVITESSLDEYTFDFTSKAENLLIESYYTTKWTPQLGQVRFELFVPNKSDLNLELGGGNVSVQGISGVSKGQTLGGTLNFSDLEGSLNFSTMGGDVIVKDCKLDGRVSTQGGEVRFINVSGNLESNSQSDVDDANYTTSVPKSTNSSGLQVDKMGGDIEVNLAPNGAKLSTLGGNILIQKAKKYVVATTNGGNIEIRSVDGFINATTYSGNIKAVMIGDPKIGDRSVELLSENGEIQLFVPEGLDMEVTIQVAVSPGYDQEIDIDCNFPIQIDDSGEWDNRRGYPLKYIYATGKTGNGKNKITITTVNGNVSIIQM